MENSKILNAKLKYIYLEGLKNDGNKKNTEKIMFNTWPLWTKSSRMKTTNRQTLCEDIHQQDKPIFWLRQLEVYGVYNQQWTSYGWYMWRRWRGII